MADTEARWYCVNAQGLPMLCDSKEDAEREAARNDKVWPKGAPHRAVQLCDAAERDRLRADVRELVELVAETVNEWDSRIVDGNDYAACKRVIENTMAPLRALLAKHKEASHGK